MSKNYVIRKNKQAVTIEDDAFINADEILEKNYPYILDSIKNEDYIMEAVIGDYFKEILFEDKVVGFAVYSNTTIGLVSLIQIYIMPEFRGNKLFLNEISSLYKKGIEICISQPNRRLVEILIHYNLAKKLTENIVVSAITFEIPPSCIESNVDCYIDSDDINLSSFYALDICSTFIVEDISANNCIIFYHMFLDDDDDYYDCITKREELLNDEYFLKIKDFFLDNKADFTNILVQLKEQLPICEEGFRSIIWDEDGLSNYMQNMVDNNIVSEERAFEIKEQLDYEHTLGMVTDEGILTRLYFLIDNNIRELTEDEMLDLLFSDEIICPYCYENCDYSDRFCRNCGYNLYYDEGTDEMDFEGILPFIDIMSEDDEEKQFAKFINLVVQDKNFRDEVFDSDDEEFKEFFDLIDDDPHLKELVINSLTDESYDEKEFLDVLDDELSDNDDFQNFFEKHGYLEKTQEVNPTIDINNLTQDDFLRLFGRKYSLSDSCELCYDNQIFKILKFVKEYNSMELPYIMDNSLSPALKDFLIREDYVSRDVTQETWNDFAQDITVPDLKNILRENNLKVSGRKQELIDRIAEADISFDHFYNDKDFITDKGRDFLKEYYWVDIFEELKYFDFDDFSLFMKNHDGEFREVAQLYLDEHLKRAFEYQNFIYLLDCYQAKSNIYVYFDDFENACKCNLKMFCLGVNPIYYEDSFFGLPLKESVIDSLIDLSEAFGKNYVLKLFDEVWDEMDFKQFIVDKKEARKILKDLLNNSDLDDYNEYLCKAYENFNN